MHNNTLTTDERYMARCIQLARNGEIGAAPNPMVGAVIVHDGRIIGEGFHARCGGPHAEVNAFAAVCDESLLPESTLYVSLEPCAHYGKTPPCAELVIRKRVKRVVVGCQDPFAKVQGRGIAMIREAGIEVEVGVLEKECWALNERFITFHLQKRPFITLKWAQTSDGVMGLKPLTGPAKPLQISTPANQRRVHHLRATHSAIMVGFNTAMLDNPSLTTRYYAGPNPVRVVMDPEGVLPASLRVFDAEVPTLVFGYKPNAQIVGATGVEQVVLNREESPVKQILKELHQRNLQSLLVEGGAKTLQQFLDLGIWDEIHVEHGSNPAPSAEPNVTQVMAPQLDLMPAQVLAIDGSEVRIYKNEKAIN